VPQLQAQQVQAHPTRVPYFKFERVNNGSQIKVRDLCIFRSRACYIPFTGSNKGKVMLLDEMGSTAFAPDQMSNAVKITANDTNIYVLNSQGHVYQYTPSSGSLTTGVWIKIHNDNASYDEISMSSDGVLFLLDKSDHRKYFVFNNSEGSRAINDVAGNLHTLTDNPRQFVVRRTADGLYEYHILNENDRIRLYVINGSTVITTLGSPEKVYDANIGLGDKVLVSMMTGSNSQNSNISLPNNVRNRIPTSRIIPVTKLMTMSYPDPRTVLSGRAEIPNVLNANISQLETYTRVPQLNGYTTSGKTIAYGMDRQGYLLQGKLHYYNVVNNTRRNYEVTLHFKNVGKNYFKEVTAKMDANNYFSANLEKTTNNNINQYQIVKTNRFRVNEEETVSFVMRFTDMEQMFLDGTGRENNKVLIKTSIQKKNGNTTDGPGLYINNLSTFRLNETRTDNITLFDLEAKMTVKRIK
jgi:hypothetical protein